MEVSTNDHLKWLAPTFLNLEESGLTHLEHEIRVAMFYWKSANLIGSPTVFYSLIENSCARVAL